MVFSKRLSITYIVVTLAMISVASAAEPRLFPFSSFNEKTDQDTFHFTQYSSIDNGALQLTPDTENEDHSFFNKSGRIMYHRSFRLWSSDNEDGDGVASFNSTFLMNIYREKNWTAGEGFAFLIASDWDIPEQSYGEWLGLTNISTDGNTANHMVAIEFDTRKQYFDPDDNHIGLNINSVKSSKTVSLKPLGIEISPEVGTNYSVWVQYNGSSKVIEVYMAKHIRTNPPARPETPLLRETINLKDYLKQDSYFGFSGSTGSTAIQLNCVLEWDLKVEEFKTRKDMTLLKIGVPALVLLVLFGVWLGFAYVKKRKRTSLEESDVLGTLKRLPGMPREFKYKELKEATNNFHVSMILGQGGFGIVYRGTLRDTDHANSTKTSAEIAVKKFSRDNIKGKDDFMAELTIIHRLRHKNLVRLVGM